MNIMGKHMSDFELILLILTSFTLVCGLVGNLFISVIIIRQKRMQTITNWFVFNLCVCDLFIVLIVIPFNTIIPHMDWPFGEFTCQYVQPILEMFAGVCVLTHTSLGVARFAVLKSALTGRTIKIKHVRITLVLVWLVPFLIMALPLMPGLLGPGPGLVVQGGQLYCLMRIPDPDRDFGYELIKFFLTYVFPMLSTGFAYFKINRIVSKNVKQMYGHMSEFDLQNRRNKSRRMNRALMTMFLTFGALTLPIHIYFFLFTQKIVPDDPEYMKFLNFLLALFYGQVVTNPFVLFYMSEEYRKALYTLPFWICRPRMMRRLSVTTTTTLHKFQEKIKARRKSSSSPWHEDSPLTASAHSRRKFSTPLLLRKESDVIGLSHQGSPLLNNNSLSNGYVPLDAFMPVTLPNEVINEEVNLQSSLSDQSQNENLSEGSRDSSPECISTDPETMTTEENGSDELLTLDLMEELNKAKQLHDLITSTPVSTKIDTKNPPLQPVAAYYDDGSLLCFYDTKVDPIFPLNNFDDERETNI
eukprot:TCONS_00017087-protein